MLNDACIYEWEVEFTQEVAHYDSCQDYSHTTWSPGTKVTLRLIADKYSEEIAEAWFKRYWKHSPKAEPKVLSHTKHDIDGVLINPRR